MDNETLFKLIGTGCGLALAILGFLKFYLDFSVNQKSKHREDYKFAKEFYADMQKIKPMQPYLIEKGYLAIVGNNYLKQHEIEYLLKLTGAATALRQYFRGKKYLKELPESGSLKVELKDQYKNSTYRSILEKLYIGSYFFNCLVAAGPFILGLYLYKFNSGFVGVSIFMPFLGVPLALMSAIAGAELLNAEKLVKNQRTHIQQIVVVN